MANILLDAYGDSPSFRLTRLFFYSLKAHSKIGLRVKLTRYITPSDLDWCDIFISLRGYNRLNEYLAEQAVKHGKYLILCLDDDLLNVSFPDVNKKIDKENKRALENIIRLSNCLLVSNPYLGEKYADEGRKYCVVNTIVTKNEIIKPKRHESDKIKIVYAANTGHKIFYDKYILPAMGKLYERYGNKLSYCFIGPEIEVEDPRIDVVRYKSMEYDAYNRYMMTHRFDIGVAPLFDDEVCRCKYFNKYIEYSKYGICGLYSDVSPYNLIVKDGINGGLANNTVESWYKVLCEFIDSKELRENSIANAQRQIEEEHNASYILGKLVNDLPQLISYVSSGGKIKKMKNMYVWFLFNEFRRRYIYR